jgi:hypothetical protein
MLLLLLCRFLWFVGMDLVKMEEWKVLPEDAPVIKATPGKRVEDMIARSRERLVQGYLEKVMSLDALCLSGWI